MSTITVLGGTGYAGTHLAREAAARGHDVVAVSRHEPTGADRLEGVDYRQVDLADDDDLRAVVGGADVVVAALSPRGGLADALPQVYRLLADEVARVGARLVVVGGFSSLRRSAGLPRVIDEGMPEGAPIPAEQLAALLAEASAMNGVLLDLEGRDDDLRWTFVSPGMDFGAHVPGEATGSYRVGTDGLVLIDDQGRSAIGGADFARAVVDQVESTEPHLGHLAVAY